MVEKKNVTSIYVEGIDTLYHITIAEVFQGIGVSTQKYQWMGNLIKTILWLNLMKLYVFQIDGKCAFEPQALRALFDVNLTMFKCNGAWGWVGCL